MRASVVFAEEPVGPPYRPPSPTPHPPPTPRDTPPLHAILPRPTPTPCPASLYRTVSLTEAHVKGYMLQILTGIAYLHGRKVMHR